MKAMGVKLFTGSNPSFEFKCGLIDIVLLEVNNKVYPSGAARETNCAPIPPPAPGLLSTTKGTLKPSLNCWVTNLTTTSAAPPGGKGVTTWTARLGYVCACVNPEKRRAKKIKQC